MIKIEKDFVNIPPSLQVPPVNSSSIATHKYRQQIIAARAYPSGNSAVDKRYKMEDIKTRLFNIYNGKCAFCEQRVERWQVEHFRPKSVYYWLAFSWDNLLYACPDCNGSKSNHFDTKKSKVKNPPVDLTQINTLAASYDATEQPKFICPEREDPEPLLVFQRDGLVKSKPRNPRCKYTLDTCQIYRPYLNDNRKKILDDFENDVKSEAAEGASKAEIERTVQVIIRKFRRDANNPKNEYLAFRRYAAQHLLSAILRAALGPE